MPRLWQPGKVNSVEIKQPLSQYEMMTGLLLPLYAGRAVEEMFYGPQGVTLSTAAEVSYNLLVQNIFHKIALLFSQE